MSTHWHDTPEFDRVRDAAVQAHQSKETDEASHVCKHFGLDYFMRSRSGEGNFMCHACCRENVELDLLALDEPPAR